MPPKTKPRKRKPADDLGQSLGVLIRDRRHELGMSQVALSKETGVPQQTIVDIEAGAKPFLETVRRLARGLKVSMDYLDARLPAPNVPTTG